MTCVSLQFQWRLIGVFHRFVDLLNLMEKHHKNPWRTKVPSPCRRVDYIISVASFDWFQVSLSFMCFTFDRQPELNPWAPWSEDGVLAERRSAPARKLLPASLWARCCTGNGLWHRRQENQQRPLFIHPSACVIGLNSSWEEKITWMKVFEAQWANKPVRSFKGTNTTFL